MKPFKFLLFIFFASSCHAGLAQTNKVDSLESLLRSKVSTDQQKARIHNLISLELRTKDFKKSKEHAKQAVELAIAAGDKSEQAKGLLNTGLTYYFEGIHEEAMKYYLQALKIYEEGNDTSGRIATLNELGTLEKKNQDLRNSEKHLQEALSLSQSLNDSSLIAHSMNNIGHLYELKGDLDKAMDYYKVSAIIKENLGSLYDASFNYDNIANVLSKQGNYKEATQYYQKEIAIFKKLNDRANYAIAINNLGEMHKMKGDYKQAAVYFEQALQISNAIRYKDLSSHICNMLSETYKSQHNYQKAYDYMVLGTSLRDSIFNEQRSKQLLDMQTKYETEKKENQIRLLEQQNEIKDFGLRQNRLFILGLIMVLLGLIIVGYLWKNRMTLKQRAELESTRATLREAQLEAVIASQEEERKRFAADLHDGLGQIISALRLNLSKENPDHSAVTHALDLLNHMNVEIRNIAFNLMPQALMKEGLEEALREFATRLNRSGDINITVNSFNSTADLDNEKKIAIYRICQEWVNNAIKYSECKYINLQVVHHPDELVITIEDDGKGFDTSTLTLGQGNGWKNINSRLALIKGNLDIDSQPGRTGTTMIIAVPLLHLNLNP
jgi:two-component system, NarL family, sensor kinase